MNPTVRKVAGILTSDFNMNNYVDLVREIFSTVKIHIVIHVEIAGKNST